VLKPPKPPFIIVAIILSLLSWAGYSYLSYIMSASSGLTFEDIERKYLSEFPSWISTIGRLRLVILLSAAIAIVLIVLSGYLNRKQKIFTLLMLMADILVIPMSFMMFM
jgi:hypothetical protein